MPTKTRTVGSREEYDFGKAGNPARAADQTYIPVVCSVCHTRMHATEDQVGRTIECPDCFTPALVPPPAKIKPAAERASPVEQVGVYALSEDVEPSATASRPAEETCFPAHCPLCNTLMKFSEDQIGQEMECPDCRKPFIVPSAPRRERKYGPRDKAAAGYETVEPSEPSSDLAASDYREALNQDRPRPTPPRWPFFSGILTFPWHRNCCFRWLFLSLTAVIPLSLGIMAALVVWPAYAGSRGHAIMLIITLGTGVPTGTAWILVASAQLLAIVSDTSDGYDRIENWPSGLFHDWMADCLFVVSSTLLCTLVVVGLDRLLPAVDAPVGLILSGVFVLLFPILLLSMMETNSPMNPFSTAVWQSLLTRWWAWGLFYVETTALIASTAWLIATIPPLSVPFLAPLLVAEAMIYFRLLGRVAWCCGNEYARLHGLIDEDEEEAEDEDEAEGPGRRAP